MRRRLQLSMRMRRRRRGRFGVVGWGAGRPISLLHKGLSAILILETKADPEHTEMAKSVNKVILLGNVGKDPEIRATAGGMTVANFSIATTDRIKGADGQFTDKTEWHNLVAFQRTAEIVRDYVKKGNKLYIEGRLSTSSWDDKATGQKKYKTEIIVGDLSLLSGRGESGGEGGGGGYSKSSTASYGSGAPAAAPDFADQGITDDDIPF
jgi:single-strand DNA-binding protein